MFCHRCFFKLLKFAGLLVDMNFKHFKTNCRACLKSYFWYLTGQSPCKTIDVYLPAKISAHMQVSHIPHLRLMSTTEWAIVWSFSFATVTTFTLKSSSLSNFGLEVIFNPWLPTKVPVRSCDQFWWLYYVRLLMYNTKTTVMLFNMDCRESLCSF